MKQTKSNTLKHFCSISPSEGLSPSNTFVKAAEAYQAIKSTSKLNILSIPPENSGYSTHLNLSPLHFEKHCKIP